MPKVKEPAKLQDLSLATSGIYFSRVCLKAIEAISSGKTSEINISGLHQYLYGNLPHVLSLEVTDHMLAVVRLANNETYEGCGNTDAKLIMEGVVMACIYPEITVLNMSHLPEFVKRILPSNIHTFNKIQTLTADDLPTDVAETLPVGLGFLKYLVKFRMKFACTDAIIQTLGSCCSTTIADINVNDSEGVTDASFTIFMNCEKLKHLSICGTSVTPEGFLWFSYGVQHLKKSISRLCVGSDRFWDITSEQLNAIPNACHMLKELRIYALEGNLEKLLGLTTLKVLEVISSNFIEWNLNSFLRVRGSNLVTLYLKDIEIYFDLSYIMNNCINIKKLFLKEVFIMDNTVTISENVKKTCQNLEILEISGFFSPLPIERMLYECVNVTRLQLCPYLEGEFDFTHEFILRLLSNNPLRTLTSFRAEGSKLTMTSVRALIEHCPLLEELDYKVIPSYHHNLITDEEVKILQQEIKDRNLDLEVNISLPG